MTRKKLNIKLPKDVLELPEAERQEILNVLKQALALPKTIKQSTMVESTIWEPNSEPLIAQLEEEFYDTLTLPWLKNCADLFNALGLELPEPAEVKKSFGADYFEAQETELVKAWKKRPNIQDLIEAGKAKRKKFLQYIDDGKAWTKKQLQQIDKLLQQNLPKYAQVAESLAVRATFINKLRSKMDTENIETMGVLLDRVPETIKASRRKTAVAKKGKKVIEVAPLTPIEVEGVKIAEQRTADKITEVQDKHRHQIRQIVMQAKRERWTVQQLASKLFDVFGDQNRDWRRVAITELAMVGNDAYLAGCAEGESVYVPTLVGACKHCVGMLEGKSFTVLSKPPAQLNYDLEMNYVWAGKSNYGRTVSTWIPCVPLHPNCRHRYQKLSRFYKIVDGKPVLKELEELIAEEKAKRDKK